MLSERLEGVSGAGVLFPNTNCGVAASVALPPVSRTSIASQSRLMLRSDHHEPLVNSAPSQATPSASTVTHGTGGYGASVGGDVNLNYSLLYIIAS
jgi:hypothetical protein